MKRGFFITGTGTGVGKTFVATMLTEQARAAGERVFAFKPIETGCSVREDVGVPRDTNPMCLLGDDQAALVRAAGSWQVGELASLYCFERPASPLAAARAEHRTIDLELVETVFVRGAAQADFVIVEGAGGWRVPITELEDMSSLAVRLSTRSSELGVPVPVIVVASAGLGTINHSLLTVEAIRRDGCEVAAVMLSRRPEDDVEFANENAAEIERCGGVKTLVVSREKVLYDTL